MRSEAEMRHAPDFPGTLDRPVSGLDGEPAPLPSPFPGPILLATDGSASATGATTLAAALVHARHARLRVLTVVEPDVVDGIAATILPARAHAYREDDRRAGQRLAVRDQLSRCADSVEHPDPEVCVGTPAIEITNAASDCGASLIVLGIRTHTILDRVFREETTLRVMRRSAVPAIGVVPLLTELPRRAVVGVDFSVSSLHAARAALPLLDDGATLYLVHVEYFDERGVPQANGHANGSVGDSFERPLLTGALPGAFERFRRLLGAPSTLRIEQVVLDGDSYPALDRFAGRVGAQLIVLGSIRKHEPTPHGGRLREGFLRAATMSVLVGPPLPRASIDEA